MKKAKAIIPLLFALFLFSPLVSAGEKNAQGPKESKIHYIWEFQSQLGLTDKQVKSLQQIYQADTRNSLQLKAELAVGQAQLQALIDANAPVKEIKSRLEKNAAIGVDLQLGDIVKTRKIKAVLTPKQLQSWLVIQQKFKQQAAAEQKTTVTRP